MSDPGKAVIGVRDPRPSRPPARKRRNETQALGGVGNITFKCYGEDVTVPDGESAVCPPPTAAPTAVPSSKPTAAPTAEPSIKPTAAPTAEPSSKPTAKPSSKPTAKPSAKPSSKPTPLPTYGRVIPPRREGLP